MLNQTKLNVSLDFVLYSFLYYFLVFCLLQGARRTEIVLLIFCSCLNGYPDSFPTDIPPLDFSPTDNSPKTSPQRRVPRWTVLRTDFCWSDFSSTDISPKTFLRWIIPRTNHSPNGISPNEHFPESHLFIYLNLYLLLVYKSTRSYRAPTKKYIE